MDSAGGGAMERFTISLESTLAQQFEDFIRAHGYSNRSEAVRDLIRERLENKRIESAEGSACIATLVYIYNHHESELASRITAAQHAHHDLTLSSMHVHLDHDNCLETVILRGPIQTVRRFADSVIAGRGVRHGKLYMVPVEITEETHLPDRMPHSHSVPIT